MSEPTANGADHSDDEPRPRFVWVDEADAARGGQWMRELGDDRLEPIALADAVADRHGEPLHSGAVAEHVMALGRVVDAVGDLEDELLPASPDRLARAAARDVPEVDPASPAGERLRRGAEALEKLASDLAEIVHETLHGGSLASLPPGATSALCQAMQAAWRVRQRIDPPGPLYL